MELSCSQVGPQGGRPADELETMVRIHLMETMVRIHLMEGWWSLGDEAMEDALSTAAPSAALPGLTLLEVAFQVPPQF